MIFVYVCSHFGSLSHLNNNLFAQAADDGNEAFLLSLLEAFLDFLGNVLEMLGLWEVDIRLDLTHVVEELESVLINIQKGVLLSLHNGGINHISSVEGALVDLGGQDISSLKDDLGGSVLTWLSGGDFSDLAWESLDHDEGSVLQSVSISLLELGGTGVGDFESFVLLLHFINQYY